METQAPQILVDDDTRKKLFRNPELLIAILKEFAPVLYTIMKLNMKYISDMNYGEITLIEEIRHGKVSRVIATPKQAEMVET